MSIQELEKALDKKRVQRLIDPDDDGSCPCSWGKLNINGYEVRIHTACWRVSDNMDNYYQDLEIDTEHPKKHKIAKILKKELDSQEWYNPYKIIFTKVSL